MSFHLVRAADGELLLYQVLDSGVYLLQPGPKDYQAPEGDYETLSDLVKATDRS